VKKKKSWDTIIFRQQIMIFLVLAVALSVLLYTVNKRTEKDIRSSNETVLRIRTEEVSMMLQSVWRNSYSIMSYLGARTSVSSNSGPMDFILKEDIYQQMQSSINMDKDIDTLYVKDTEEGDLILVINSSRSSEESILLQNYIKNNDIPKHSTTSTICDVLSIGGQAYYSMVYQSGKYSIGALSSLSHYDSRLLNDVNGSEIGYVMIQGNRVIYSGGHDWSGSLDENEHLKAEAAGDVIVASSNLGFADMQIMLLSKADTIAASVWSSDFLALLALLIAVLGFDYALRRKMITMVSVPIDELTDAYKEISEGNISYRITKQSEIIEFDQFKDEFNKIAEEISQLRIEEYEQKLDKQQTDLEVMRAQLRPHFYLNAITTVISMTYQDRDEDIRKYLMALSKFMRSMLQMDLRMVPLKDELANIESYLAMQKIRYPGMITSFIACDPKVADINVPFLVLFTAVENIFKHGRGGDEKTSIYIQCQPYQEGNFQGIRMIAEDSGSGFSEEVLERYQTGENVREMGEHIGLSNVYRTLELTYQRSDLLRLSNTKPSGARVEILIPCKGDSNENTDC